MSWPRATVLVRWIIAALIFGYGLFLLTRVMSRESEWISVFGKSLFGIAGLITGVLLVSPELVRLAVSPISRLIDSILLPSETVEPVADFKLAHFYGEKGRYAEACEEYEKILHYHPDNTEAYLEGIRAAALAGNESLARKFHHGAQRVMRSADQGALLASAYEARNHPLIEASEEPPPLPEAAGDVQINTSETGPAAQQEPPPSSTDE